MEAQENHEGSTSEVMESEGQPTEMHEGETQHEGGGDHDDLPKGVKERLGRQERKHQREMREMQSRMEMLHAKLSNQPEQQPQHQMDAPQGVDEQIHRAVSYALQHKENEERKAKEAESQRHVEKQHEELKRHLNNVADKYDDFDDVVHGEDSPFTHHMVTASLMLPKKGAGSAGEVLYKLGKNPEELKRIAKLHPIDQASEMVKLSHALMGGESEKSSSPRPLGQIKNSPVANSRNISDKTPISELRQRMKSNWK